MLSWEAFKDVSTLESVGVDSSQIYNELQRLSDRATKLHTIHVSFGATYIHMYNFPALRTITYTGRDGYDTTLEISRCEKLRYVKAHYVDNLCIDLAASANDIVIRSSPKKLSTLVISCRCDSLDKLIMNVDGTNNLSFRKLSLRSLKLTDCKIGNWPDLSKVTNLKKLYLNGSDVSDLSLLSSLPELTYLDISNTEVKDISALSGLNLVCLYANSLGIQDFECIGNMTNLKHLGLSSNRIKDIKFVEHLINLVKLCLDDNRIIFLDPIKNCINLNYLFVNYNAIISLDCLSECKKLYALEANVNQIFHNSDLSGLKDLSIVEIEFNYQTEVYVPKGHTFITKCFMVLDMFTYCVDDDDFRIELQKAAEFIYKTWQPEPESINYFKKLPRGTAVSNIIKLYEDDRKIDAICSCKDLLDRLWPFIVDHEACDVIKECIIEDAKMLCREGIFYKTLATVLSFVEGIDMKTTRHDVSVVIENVKKVCPKISNEELYQEVKKRLVDMI